jgi:uncharacterized protein (TIGR03083 family)
MSDRDAEASARYAAAYGMVRERVQALVAGTPPEALDAPAPATPKWTAKDVLSHMVGLCDDVLARRLDGVTTEPWTDAQVLARRDRTPQELLDEWTALAPEFEAGVAQLPPVIAGQILFDTFTHEHDIRHAIGAPGGRDGDALALVFQWLVDVRSASGAPALRFETEAGTVVAGDGEPATTITASRFELVRATTGRRSASEMAAYGWDPEPDPPLLVAAPIFTIRDTPLAE